MGWLTKEMPKTLTVECSAFEMEAAIPRKFTCDGENVSPPLKIGNLEEGTKTIVLIMDDPDAPAKTWVHWVFWNLPADTTTIEEGADVAAMGAIEGKNDFGDVGYGGPCPPGGTTHGYQIKVYALDGKVDLERGATVEDLKKALAPRVLAWGMLVGTYTRQ